MRTDYSIMHLMHRAAQGTDALFGKKAKGLTPRQFVVLDTLQKMGTASQTDLVRKTGIDRSTMADVIQRLMGKNLVHRKRSVMDARAYEVTLTTKAQKMLDELRAAVEEIDQIILDAVPERERKGFVSGLHTLAQSVTVERNTSFHVA